MQAGSSGAVPKRERVRGYLLGLIESGAPGDVIPSERRLCRELGVSRPTLRAAVDELVATGQLVREHGRGMFVAPAKITQELVAAESSFAVPPAAGTWSSTVLEMSTGRAGARIGRRLRVLPAAELVYIARLRLVDGAPVAIEHLHIPVGLVPGLTLEEMEATGLYDHLREHHRVVVHEAVQSIEPTVVNEAEAQVLEVPLLSPALLIERLTTDRTGMPVEYVRSVYRGDWYRIVSRLALGTRAPSRPSEGHYPGIPPDGFAHRGIIASSTMGDVQPT